MEIDPSTDKQIFFKNGQERTIFLTSIPILLKGLYLKETNQKNDQIDVWVIKDRQDNDDFEKELDLITGGEIDAEMKVGKAKVTHIRRDELQEKLVKHEQEALGMTDLLASTKTFEKLTADRATRLDVAATTHSDLLHDIDILREKNMLPASYILDFHTSALQNGLNLTVRAVGQTYGPIVGNHKVAENLKLKMIDADVLNERRNDGKPSNKPSQRLILIFT